MHLRAETKKEMIRLLICMLTYDFFPRIEVDREHIIGNKVSHVLVPLLHHGFLCELIGIILNGFIVRDFFYLGSSDIPLIILSLPPLSFSVNKMI